MNTDDDMDKPATKRELHEALGLWGGALEARLDAKMDARFDAFEATLDQKLDAKFEVFARRLDAKVDAWGNQLSAEIKQRFDILLDVMSTHIARLDAKWDRRISAVEASRPAARGRRRRS